MKPIVTKEEQQLRHTFATSPKDPRLEEFQKNVRAYRTSDLICFVTNPETVINAIGLDLRGLAELEENAMMVLTAGLLIVCADEINRRIPIPEIP